jgi:outer membrane receptor protein involved in Fe transport
MYSRKLASAAMSAAVVTLSAGVGFAQTSLGILAGVARDQTGAVVPNATVTITNQQNGQKRTASTQNDGAYRFDSITPGLYTVDVTATGFTTSVLKDVNVVSTAVSSYDVKLAVGGANTEVEVEASQATVNTENGTLTGGVGAVEIDKLPIFSLSPYELASTVPGVQTVSNGGGFSNGIDIQVNGARPRANNFLLDGQEINDVSIGGQAFQPIIPDVFDSLNVITSAASAEYGRAGGAVVNLVTKAGTNTYHGEVFERYTGSGLDSVPGVLRGTPGFQKTRFDQQNYGFIASGPIIKNKLFAEGAGSYSRYYGSETPGINLLPNAAGYATLQQITGAPAAQVAILDNYLSNGSYLTNDVIYPTTVTQNLGNLPGCPAGGCVVAFAGFQRPAVHENNPETQWMYRIDYRPWDRDSFTVRYLHDRSSLTPDFFNNPDALAGFDTDQGGPAELGEGSWTHVFSPRLENEFRLAETRIGYTFAPTAQTLANPLNSLPTLNFAGITASSIGASFPALGPNQNFPQGRREDLYQFQDTVGWTLGRQSFRIGYDLGRQIEIDLVSQNALGAENFVKGGSSGATVSSLSNFLQNQTGPSGTVTKVFGPTRDDAHDWRNGVFAQDDVKLTSDLTVNLGFRWDYLTDPENSLKYPGLDPNNIFAPINTVVKIQPDYNDFSPRIGFAFAPHDGGFLRDGKTVIRGGFGIFYDSTFSNILVNSTQSSPNSVSFTDEVTTGNGVVNPAAALASATAVLNPFSTVESEVSNFKHPLTYQYNVGVERELPGSNVLAVRYVGNRAYRLYANQQYNYFANGARLNPTRGAIIARGNFAASDYNSAIVEFTHNFHKGFSVKANYVFGKDLDDGSEVFTTFSSPTSYSANLAPGGRGQDWGPSAYDHRQYFSVAYVWEPKGFHSDNKLVDAAEWAFTRGWVVSGVSQLQSGAYATFSTSGLDTNGDGSTANDRPIIGSYSAPITSVGIDGAYLGATQGQYYDLSQANTTGAIVPVNPGSVRFIVPYGPQNQFLHQEIGRNSYQLPGTTTHNLALEKGFGLGAFHLERGRFILRAEAQNVFNHNDGAQPDTDTLDAGQSFLTPGRQETNRTLVLWGKIQF